MSQPAQGTSGGKKRFNWTGLIIGLLILAAIVLFAVWIFGGFSSSEVIRQTSYFITDLNSGNVRSLTLNPYGDQIYVHTQTSSYLVQNPRIGDLVNEINHGETAAKAGLNFEVVKYITQDGGSYFFASPPSNGQSIWVTILLSFGPTLLFLLLLVWMARRQMGGGGSDFFNPGRNQAQRITSKKRFSDVAGQEEAKEEVSEVVDFLKNPNKYRAAGARIPKGIMLGGPPGTGKTLLAKAVAGEAEVPFYFISASNFVEMFAGVGAKRVREMFKEARKNAPSILFIDELDAVGRRRGSSLSGNDEREQTLNQILVEMDGMEESSGLLIIAATNRPDVLDPALLRPGRFDRTITVNLPDIKEREQILRLHAKGKRIAKEVNFTNIAQRTPRYSGAQLENVINEATLLSVRENSPIITLLHIDEAIDRVTAGPAKKHRVITPEENERVAVHEAGHAVIGLKVKDADIVQKITIIPRGDAGGYTLMTPKKELNNYSKSQLLAMIMGLLGGRAAEQVKYGMGEVATGATNDIERATAIARAMVTQYGMSELGPIAYERDLGSQYLGSTERSREYSDALAERIDGAIRSIIIHAEKKALEIIQQNTQLLGLIVEELIEKETIVFEEIQYINEHLKRPPKKHRTQARDLEQPRSLDDIIKDIKQDGKKPSQRIVQSDSLVKPKSTESTKKTGEEKPKDKEDKPKTDK